VLPQFLLGQSWRQKIVQEQELVMEVYTPAAHNREGTISSKLRNLDCEVSNFAKIAVGICGRTRLVEALSDSRRPLDKGVAERLLEKLSQMTELQEAVFPVPIDWTKWEQVSTALTIRLAASIDKELHGETVLEDQAHLATESVKK
jgi:hypothetical protein